MVPLLLWSVCSRVFFCGFFFSCLCVVIQGVALSSGVMMTAEVSRESMILRT